MAIISNTVQNSGGGASASVTPRSQTYRSGNSVIRLAEGETIKGVVSDVHGSEITLSTEDGASFTGKLPDAGRYSIGQKAAFVVTGLTGSTIYLKAASSAYLLNMEDTIEQALEEAGLPKTPRNLDVVRSLLLNQQSISRESITSSIQLCARFADADVNSVITMNRLHMPLTPDTIRQFDNYQNQTHSLLARMDSLTDSLGDMLHAIGTQVPRLASNVGTALLSLALDSDLTPEEITLAQHNRSESSSQPDVSFKNPPDDAMLSGGETGTDVLNEAETAALTTDGKTPLDSAADAASAGPFARMRKLFSGLTDSTGITGKTPLSGNDAPSFIHEQAGSLLSLEDCQDFADFIEEFPLPEQMKQRLRDGTVTAREFLTEIQHAFPRMTEEQSAALLADKRFHAIVKGQFLSNWTISPEGMKQKDAMQKLYEKMSRQFDALSHFSESLLGKDVFTGISDNASNMTENMDFMRLLNETFQYIQLPVKLQNQNTHGDLYVMTRKEALKKDPRHLKVLLHLDMAHLGTLDVHVSRENAAIAVKFYVSDKDTKVLLEKNVELLQDAINKQGYAFSSSFEMKEKDMDIVNDFIASEAPPVGDLKRYNFDLRA